jgi:hypothetical protein
MDFEQETERTERDIHHKSNRDTEGPSGGQEADRPKGVFAMDEY